MSVRINGSDAGNNPIQPTNANQVTAKTNTKLQPENINSNEIELRPQDEKYL